MKESKILYNHNDDKNGLSVIGSIFHRIYILKLSSNLKDLENIHPFAAMLEESIVVNAGKMSAIFKKLVSRIFRNKLLSVDDLISFESKCTTRPVFSKKDDENYKMIRKNLYFDSSLENNQYFFLIKEIANKYGYNLEKSNLLFEMDFMDEPLEIRNEIHNLIKDDFINYLSTELNYNSVYEIVGDIEKINDYLKDKIDLFGSTDAPSYVFNNIHSLTICLHAELGINARSLQYLSDYYKNRCTHQLTM